MRGVACDDEHERLDDVLLCLPRIRFEPDLHVFVQANAVLELDLLNLVRGETVGVKFFCVATAGSLTKPSCIALASG